MISIIVPVYNVEVYLPRCIESILSQTYSDFELILVDDGSSDNSLSICEKYAGADGRIIVLSKPNGGLSSARNFGLEKANGEFYSFIDSDDWVSEDFLETLLDLIVGYESDIAVVNYAKVSDNTDEIGGPEQVSVTEWTRDEAVKCFFEQTKTNVAVWNKLYRKNVVENIRFPDGQVYEDYCYQIDVLKNVNKVVCSDSIKYYYFQRPGSIVHSKTAKREADNILTFYSCLQIIRKCFPYEEEYCMQQMANHYYFLTACSAFLGGIGEKEYILGKVKTIFDDPHRAIKSSENPFSNIFYTYIYHSSLMTKSEKKILQRDYRECWRDTKFAMLKTPRYFIGVFSLALAAKLSNALTKSSGKQK